MLTFLRKIRRSLIESGSARKYLIYAIGEIALVVIGILIALQINNWNEEKKTQNQITLFLENLIVDINEDLVFLNEVASLQEFRSNCLKYILKESDISLLDNDHLPKTSNTYWEGAYPDSINREFIDKCFLASTWIINADLQTGTIDEIKNIGVFSNIQNDKLKRSINRYYGFLQARFIQKDWNHDLILDWRKFWVDNFEVVLTEDIPSLESPIELVKGNKSVSTRTKELIGPAEYRASNALRAIRLGEEILKFIRDELGE